MLKHETFFDSIILLFHEFESKKAKNMATPDVITLSQPHSNADRNPDLIFDSHPSMKNIKETLKHISWNASHVATNSLMHVYTKWLLDV